MRNDRSWDTTRRVLLIGLMLGLSVAATNAGAPASAGQPAPAVQPEFPSASDLPDGAWVVTTAAFQGEGGDYVWEAGHYTTRSVDDDPVVLDDGLLVALTLPLMVLRDDDDAGQPVDPFSGFPIDHDEPILPLAGSGEAPFLLIGLPAEADAPEREPFDESPAPTEPFSIPAGDYVLAVLSAPETNLDDLLASTPMRDLAGPVFIVTADDLDLDGALPGSESERQAWAEGNGETVEPRPSTGSDSAADVAEPVWLVALVPAPDTSDSASSRSSPSAPGASSTASASTQPSGTASPKVSPSASASASASPSASPSPAASATGSGSDSGSIEVIRNGPPLSDLFDLDDDGLTLAEERDQTHTNPTIADTDGDGLLDGNDVAAGCFPLVQDTDEDGLNDAIEVDLYRTSCRQADTDADGLTDRQELFGSSQSSDPLVADTDGDGLDDGDEYAYSTDPRDQDWDSDGLSDGLDVQLGLVPTLADTDRDCIGDGTEYLSVGTDPLASDTDGDGYGDYNEVDDGTDPLNPADYASDHGPVVTVCDGSYSPLI